VLNPICHLLALLGVHPILHVSRIRVNNNSISSDYERLQDLILLFEIPMGERVFSKFIENLGTLPLKFSTALP